jgi:hypothetical protein
MERCQTILPPCPPALTTFRASLGALWFRASSAVRSVFHRASRPPRRPRLTAPVQEPCTPVLSAPTSSGQLTLPQCVPQAMLADDRWLRPTEVLPPNG